MHDLGIAAKIPHCEDVITLFNQLFVTSLQTCLIGGAEEPIYLPRTATAPLHRIIFTRDYFSSALHEIAHWCVAGPERRELQDFGYWYAPDGRSVAQQQKFEQVEVKPQALEWIFSRACGVPFRVSADNLAQGLGASDEFKSAIVFEARRYCTLGLPARAKQFVQALSQFYEIQDVLAVDAYQVFALE